MLSNPRKLQQYKTPRTGFVALATAALLLVSGQAFAQEAECLREAKTASKPTMAKRQAANASKTVATKANRASAEEIADLRAVVEALTKKIAEQDKNW